MKRSFSYDMLMHYTMALVGGFLSGCAVLGRCDVLGAAQTSNLIHLVLDLLGRDFVEVLIRLGAMALYGAAIVLTVVISRYTSWALKPLAIILDGAAVLLLGFFPQEMNNVLALYPMFFCLAFQWNAFPGAEGYASSTIFSTNNFRQAVMAFTNYAYTKDAAFARKGRFFAGTLLSYHFGVAVAWLFVLYWGLHGVWFCLLPLTACGAEYLLSLRLGPPAPGKPAPAPKKHMA